MKKQNKKGFSLLELVLVLGVGSMMAFMRFQDMKNEQETIIANAVGQQIKQVGEAVNGYINIRYDKLSTLSSSSSQSSDPGPRVCNASGCEITYQTLVNEGLLPASYTGINAQKSSYKIILKRSGISPNYVVNGLITTTLPWMEGDKYRYDLLGRAMQAAGIDSGMTQSATLASGLQGAWKETATDYSNITSAGLMAYRVGYDSSMYSVYLRRDGTLPMTGDLNMGGKSIKNVQDITAAGSGDFGGNIISGGTISAAGQVIAHNGYGNSLVIGGDAVGNNFEIKISGQKQLDILSDNNSSITLVANGRIEVKNPQNGTVGVNINDEGAINTIGEIKASGNIVSDKGLKGATVESIGRTTVGEYIKINGLSVAGNICQSNGLLSRDDRGAILSCVSGKWQYNTAVSNSVKCYSSTGYIIKNTGVYGLYIIGNNVSSQTSFICDGEGNLTGIQKMR